MSCCCCCFFFQSAAPVSPQRALDKDAQGERPWETDYIDLRYESMTIYLVRAAAYVIASGINSTVINTFYQMLEFALSSKSSRMALEAVFALCGDTSVPTANVQTKSERQQRV